MNSEVSTREGLLVSSFHCLSNSPRDLARLLLASVGIMIFTMLPAVVEFSVRPEQADFSKLVSQLSEISLRPDGWQLSSGDLEFEEFWRKRLRLHDHRNVVLTTPEGIRITVLVMLSEMGEQLFHTPAICYEAHGCEVSGDELLLSLAPPPGGEARAVDVVFSEFAEANPRTAVFSYWVSSQWKCPPQSSILNQLGREPFLLKVQLLVERAKASDTQTRAAINNYFSFLGTQFRRMGV